MKINKKSAISIALVFCLAIGGVFSYLFATDKKDNVFTTGNLTVRLHESDWFTSDANDMEVLIDDAKVINSSLSDVYDSVSAEGTTVEETFVPKYTVTMFNSSDQEVNNISEASYFTAVNDDENITYRSVEGNKTVESNGINDFAEGVIAGQEIHAAPYVENEGGASCWAYITFKTPTLSVEESYLNENGQIIITDEKYSIEVTGYAIQKGYGNINEKDPKYNNNTELLLRDIWSSVAAASLPKQRTMNDRVNFISFIEPDNEDWIELQYFKGADNYNYYIFGYNKALSGKQSTTSPVSGFMISGYQIKAFECPTGVNEVPANHNSSAAIVGYNWIMTYGYNTQQKESDETTPKSVVLSAGAVLQPEYSAEKGSWEFNIVLADGNIICTDYVPNLYYGGDASTGPGSTQELSVYWGQYNINKALMYENSTIAYTVPALARGYASATYAVNNSRANYRDVVGIPVLALTTNGTATTGDLNLNTTTMPLNSIKIKQSDNTYKAWKLKMPLTSETQVKMNSTGAVFYNGSYADWLEACINTGMLLGNYTYLV